MEKLLLILTILLAPSVAFANITFDAASTTSLSGSATVSTNFLLGNGSNHLLVVGLNCNQSQCQMREGGSAQGNTVSVVYNGQSLKNIANIPEAPSSQSGLQLWYLATTTGSLVNGTLTVTSTSSVQVVLSIASYFGAKQTNSLDATSTVANANPSTTAQDSLTTTAAKDYIISTAKNESGGAVMTSTTTPREQDTSNATAYGDMRTSVATKYNFGWTFKSGTTMTEASAAFFAVPTFDATVTNVKSIVTGGKGIILIQ